MKASTAILICTCLFGAANIQSAKAETFGFEYWDSWPLTGSVSCNHPDLLQVDEYNLSASRTLGSRTLVCVLIPSLIVTESGARVQVLLASEYQQGNRYGTFWEELNCKTMETRSIASGWSFQGFEPSPEIKSSHLKWGDKFFHNKNYNIWFQKGWRDWSGWKPIVSNMNHMKWLCKQWRDQQDRF